MTPSDIEALLREADEWRGRAFLTPTGQLIQGLARELRAALADAERIDWLDRNAAVYRWIGADRTEKEWLTRAGSFRDHVDAARASAEGRG